MDDNSFGARLAAALREKGFSLPEDIYSYDDVRSALLKMLKGEGEARC